MTEIKSIRRPIEKELNDFEPYFRNALKSDIPLLGTILNYLYRTKGKQIRPMFVFLSAKLHGETNDYSQLAACSVELLHSATLVHDDVVDESSMRRGRPTANTQWSNQSCVLVGDFLYSRSFEMMVRVNSMRIMEILAKVTCVLAEGEVMQLTNVRNPKVSEKQYREVIYAKTAKLFEGATQTAAVLAEATLEQQEAMREYGAQLGLAFQLIDDLLDYQGDAATMGKNVGDDLAEGKATLPLIYAMAQGTEAEALLIRQAIRKGGLDSIDEVLAIVNKTGALDYTREQARLCSEKAKACLEVLPASQYKEALLHLTDVALGRKS